MGYKQLTGVGAAKGTIIHKALEILAHQKVLRQNDQQVYYDKEIDIEIDQDYDDIDELVEISFDHYKNNIKNFKKPLAQKDLTDCVKWTHLALDYNNGQFDPRKQDIIKPEQFFDFEIKKDWAKYSFSYKEEQFKGYLAVKGTIDLIIRVSDDTYEVIDYKTGQRKNFLTGKKKELHDFQTDPQLLIYHYALHSIFPDVKQFIMTMFYVRDGGPYTVCMGETELRWAENLLRKRFEEIKRNRIPKLLSNTQQDWKCKYLCRFSKEKMGDNGQNMCTFFKNEIKNKGMTYITKNYTVDGHSPNYYAAPGVVD